jgi:hypothetical protein
MPELALIANFSSSTAIILQPIKPTAKTRKGFNKQTNWRSGKGLLVLKAESGLHELVKTLAEKFDDFTRSKKSQDQNRI